MLPDVAKTASSCLLHWTRIDRWLDFQGLGHKMPVVVAYHRVVENFHSTAGRSIPSMLISRRTFEQHLDLLANAYQLISLDELVESVEQGRPFRHPAAAITFDDGYRDVYDNAFPVLQRKGIPAAVFVVTNLVGKDHLQRHDWIYRLFQQFFENSPSASWVLMKLLRGAGLSLARASHLVSEARDPYHATRVMLVSLSPAELQRVIDALESSLGASDASGIEDTAMSWEMLAEMHRAGFTIGSHTHTHMLLPNGNKEQVAEELKTSRLQLEAVIGAPIFHLAYPDGKFTSDILLAAAAAGYRYGYTTCHHQDSRHPLLTIPRTVVWENSWLDFRGHVSPSIMSCHLNGVFELLSGCTQNHRLNAREVPSDLPAEVVETRS